MSKKTLATSFLAILFIVGIVQHHSVVTARGFDWAAMTEETEADAQEGTSDIGQDEVTTNNNTGTAPKKQGNSFARAIGAPFRALGRLFGGNKSNEQQARRTNEKDAQKFETVLVTRIKDSTVASPQSTLTTQASTTSSPSLTEFDLRLQKGRERLVAGDLDGAIAELSSAASLNPKSAEVNNLLGIAFEGKGLRDRALESFEVAVRKEEKNPEYLNNFGFLLYKNGDYDRATKYLKRAAKLSPKDARIWNNLALTQCQRNKFDDAFESFVKAVGEFGGHLNIAAQLQTRGYAKDAIKHLEKAQAISPNSVDVLSKLVALYELTGRPTDAETARRSIVALKTFADAK